MIFGVPAKVIATVFALGAFAVAVIAGLAAGNPSSAILINAIIAMAACHVIGLMIGGVMEHTVTEHIEGYRAAHPVPKLEGLRIQAEVVGESDVENEVDNFEGG